MNIFGLLFGLFAFYAINEIKHDGFHPDATNILGQYEWYRAITGQPEDGKLNAPALPGAHTATGVEIFGQQHYRLINGLYAINT